MVKVFVGQNRESFTIHKKLICAASLFFDQAFNGGFKEASESSIDLPDDRVGVFETFVYWLYQGNIGAEDDYGDSLAHDEMNAIFNTMIDIYLSTDAKCCCNKLKNDILDTIQMSIYIHEWYLEAHDIVKIFNNTMPNTDLPIRKFCNAYLHWQLADCKDLDSKQVAKIFEACPNALQLYLVYSGAEINYTSSNPLNAQRWGKCKFHKHEKGKSCDDE